MKTTKCESCGAPVRLHPGTYEDPMPKWWQRTSIREIAEDIFAADPNSPALKSEPGATRINLPPEAEVWIEHTSDKCSAPDRSPSEAYLRQKLVGAGDTVEVQSGAVEAVLAELDRVRRIESAARIYIQHWNAVDDWKIVREYELRRDLARELGEEKR